MIEKMKNDGKKNGRQTKKSDSNRKEEWKEISRSERIPHTGSYGLLKIMAFSPFTLELTYYHS